MPGRELGRGEHAECGVWTVVVIVASPVLDDDLGFEHRVELFHGQTFVAQPGVERLDPGLCHGDPGSMK